MKYYSLFVSLILLSCITAAQEQNILLIIADDVGVDPIEGYMTEATIKAHMPTLDSLMQQGLTFDNVWTNPICSPTRSAILSGRYGFRTGVYDAVIYNEIPEDEIIGSYGVVAMSQGDPYVLSGSTMKCPVASSPKARQASPPEKRANCRAVSESAEAATSAMTMEEDDRG